MERTAAVHRQYILSPRRLVMEVGPGLLLCAAIAVPAYELSRFHPSLDALAVSLILGMVLRNVLGPQASVQPGVSLASRIFIPLGIILYGTRLDFLTFSNLPLYTSLLVIGGMIAFFFVILIAARHMGIDQRTGLLLASGSAICGASAIAVLSPVVGARSRDTSIALIVTTTAGLSGAILYPLFADWLTMSPLAYGLFCGSTLQQTGAVNLAASHLGEAAVAFAMPVKMLRVAMLAPAMIALVAMTSITHRKTGGEQSMSDLFLAIRRAWFIPLFLGMAVLFSFSATAAGFKSGLDPVATLFLSMALASIGLTVDFDSIKDSGTKPLIAGFAGWGIVSILVLLVLFTNAS